jgi:hypothetical protein
MLKKKIKYMDFNEIEREEDFYFNLTKSEITEIELSTEGGLVEKIEKIVAAKDGAEIMTLFKTIILKSYGEKSPDGKRFVKSEDLSIAFSQTNAYDQLFMSLVTDPDASSQFINGIVPAEQEKYIDAQKPSLNLK